MLNNVRFILVNTSHPGNIGAAARAMKTMELDQLYLVGPAYFPHVKAFEMASGALDVLDKAVVVSTLDDAITDCELLVGTSARLRTIPWPLLTPRDFATKAVKEDSKTMIGVLFGREQSGLTNEELQRCHFHIQIPANPKYSSLNLAAAVQILAYELKAATLTDLPLPADYPYAKKSEVDAFYQHLESVLITLQFLNPNVPRQLMTRLKRLFNRTRLDVMEVNILRGILGSIEKMHSKS